MSNQQIFLPVTSFYDVIILRASTWVNVTTSFYSACTVKLWRWVFFSYFNTWTFSTHPEICDIVFVAILELNQVSVLSSRDLITTTTSDCFPSCLSDQESMEIFIKSEANSEMAFTVQDLHLTLSHAIVILLMLPCQLSSKSMSHIPQAIVVSVFKQV